MSLAPPTPGVAPAPLPPPVPPANLKATLPSLPSASTPESNNGSYAPRPSSSGRRSGKGSGHGNRRNTLFITAVVGVIALFALGAAMAHRIRSAPSSVERVGSTVATTSATASSTATSAKPATTTAVATTAAKATAPSTGPSTTSASSVAPTTAESTAPTDTANGANNPATTAVPLPPIVPAAKAARDRAESVTREFLRAISSHNWARASALQPSGASSDADWAAFFQPLVAADMVTLRADAIDTDKVDLFVGQIAVKVVAPGSATITGSTAASASTSASGTASGTVEQVTDLSCAKYRVDVDKGLVLDVVAFPVETRAGALSISDVSTQLRGCIPPG